MGEPKHHYVPQFYLRRFCDASGLLHVWDRDQNRTFSARAGSVAAEKSFYFLDRYADLEPFEMERQFSALEGEVALITSQWVKLIRGQSRGTRIAISRSDREHVALFLCLQFLRTADTRDILARVAAGVGEAVNTDVGRRVKTMACTGPTSMA